MLEVLVGAILATALLYIGRCWGKQEQTISIKTEPIGQDVFGQDVFGQDDFNHMIQNGRATKIRRGRVGNLPVGDWRIALKL